MIEARERKAVVDALRISEARLLELVRGLTEEQWRFRESPERWSIAENVEHLILFEGFIRSAVIRALVGAAASEERRAEVRAKESQVMGLAQVQPGQRFKARSATTPTGRWMDCDAMVAELRSERATMIAFAKETNADLRGHFFAHITFGDLDCYQWLVLLARHMERHALQIAQVKADEKWPAAVTLK